VTVAAAQPGGVRLDGRVAIVTGAGAGLGRLYARHFAARGACVVVNDVQQDAGGWTADQVAAEILAAGGRAIADRNSVATPEGGAAIVAAAAREFGTVDAVVANAGIIRRGAFDELSVDDVRAVLAVNLEGAIWVTRAAFPLMKAQQRGRIVLVASSAGIYGHGVGANYCASKGGVVGLLRALSIEGEGHGVRANAISPFALTPMTSTTPGLTAEVAEQLDPLQVAPVAVYLASDECTLNGQILAVAGGTVARTFSATTVGWRAAPGTQVTPESVRDNLEQILDPLGAAMPAKVRDERQHLLGARPPADPRNGFSPGRLTGTAKTASSWPGSTLDDRWQPPPDATLVLLNSLGSDAAAWQFTGITGGHSVSYPGHGTRPRQPGWTHEGMADEVMAVFDGPLDLVGVALGVLIALQALVRHPGRIRSAVIACGGSVRDADTRIDALRKVAVGRGQAAAAGGMAPVVEETLARWFTPSAIHAGHAGVEYARKALLAIDPGAWSDVWLSLVNSSYVCAEDAARIRAPVTLVGGTEDRSSGLGGVSRLHELILTSRLEILTGPHMMHLEQPVKFRAAIERHFAWLPTASRVAEPITSPS
jgi:NAD(P)-dependent dehydrogenase (short-subunit alcohol dehydrogenase family)/pimeloyl-ACP methyl ester carboxylesterase